MAEAFDETKSGLETAKWVAISTNLNGYANEFHDTKEAAEKAAAEWATDDDEELIVVAKITTRFTGAYPPRVVTKTDVR